MHRESGDLSCFTVNLIDVLISQKVALLNTGISLNLKKCGGFSEKTDNLK